MGAAGGNSLSCHRVWLSLPQQRPPPAMCSLPPLPETLGCLLHFSLNVATVIRQMLSCVLRDHHRQCRASPSLLNGWLKSTKWLRAQASLSLSTSLPTVEASRVHWSPEEPRSNAGVLRGTVTRHQTCWLFRTDSRDLSGQRKWPMSLTHEDPTARHPHGNNDGSVHKRNQNGPLSPAAFIGS